MNIWNREIREHKIEILLNSFDIKYVSFTVFNEILYKVNAQNVLISMISYLKSIVLLEYVLKIFTLSIPHFPSIHIDCYWYKKKIVVTCRFFSSIKQNVSKYQKFHISKGFIFDHYELYRDDSIFRRYHFALCFRKYFIITNILIQIRL